MTKFISIIAAAAMAITGCSSGQSAQAEEPIKTIDERAEEIISDMTLEEKVGQMFLVRYTDDEKAVSDIDSADICCLQRTFKTKQKTML